MAPDAHATTIRKRVGTIGGHASLIRGADEVRRAIDVFHPQDAGLTALGQRIKHSFDPKNILNRGRMSRGPAT
jgi:glycolate oxidase FAD binding subunit